VVAIEVFQYLHYILAWHEEPERRDVDTTSWKMGFVLAEGFGSVYCINNGGK
jgi:hypothetical protein